MTFLLAAENYQFLLELAEEYQMERVKELCCEFLSCNVQDTNCVKFYMIAEKFSLQSIMNETLQESKFLPLTSLENDEVYRLFPLGCTHQVFGQRLVYPTNTCCPVWIVLEKITVDACEM